MKVEDDRGNTWLVLPGDPASEYVNALKRRNYSWVVLPVKLLAYGAGHGLPKLRLHTDLEGLVDKQSETWYNPLSRAREIRTADPPAGLPPSADALVRATRLSDCLNALREAGLIPSN